MEIKSRKNKVIKLQKKQLFGSQMWVSVDSKIKSYQIYWKIALFFIFLYQVLIFQPLQPQAFLLGW